MSTTTVYAEFSDGYLVSGDAAYATARSGSVDGVDDTDSMFGIGQAAGWGPGYQCFMAFIDFDTSGIPDGDEISAAEFSLYPQYADNSATWDIRVYACDFGDSLTAADWVAPASWAGMTLLCHFEVTPSNWTGGYRAFVNDGTALISAINKTGHTRVVLVSSRLVAGTTPSAAEYIEAQSNGGTNKPKLVITHAAPATYVPVDPIGMMGLHGV